MDTPRYSYPKEIHSDKLNPLENFYRSVAPVAAVANRNDFKKYGLKPQEFFEGYHLYKYIVYLLTDEGRTELTNKGNPVKDDPEYTKNYNKFDRILKNNEYKRGLEELLRMPSGKGIKSTVSENIIQSIADFQKVHFLRCFERFLRFCLDQDKPLYHALDYPQYWHKENIEIIEATNKATLPDARAQLETVINELSIHLDSYQDDQLDALYLRTSDEETQARRKTSYGDVLKTENVIQKPKKRRNTYSSEEHWLSPRNKTFIPFINRDQELDELKELDAFAKASPESEIDFKLWAIVGPSGAGKTRLLNHWINRDIYHDWDVIDVCSNTAIKWEDWEPDYPTLIYIDYIYGYDKVIVDIISRMEATAAPLSHPVRLLLLDHAAPEKMAQLLKDSRWGFEGKRAEDFSSIETKFFFKEAPLKLQVSKDNKTFLAKIICAVAYREDDDPYTHIDDPTVQRGVHYLSEATAMWEPLFAALVGDAIRNYETDKGDPEEYLTLNRRDLIKHHLQGRTRLTWLMDDRDNSGAWAACFIAAATARRGADFETLLQAIPKKAQKTILKDYKKFKHLCNGVISGNDMITLGAFEPDIFGETHFLLLLQEMIEGKLLGFKDVLSALIAVERADANHSWINEFFAFSSRLAYNLSNDNQTDADTRNYWKLFVSFLKQGASQGNKSFKWAVSTACFDIYWILKEKNLMQQAETFFNLIDGEDLYHSLNKEVTKVHAMMALHYFNIREGEGKPIPQSLINLLSLWDSCDQSQGCTALMMSLWANNMTIAEHLIDKGAHLEQKDTKQGRTPLMIACVLSQEKLALKLVDKDANLGAQNDLGVTALMIACLKKMEVVALKLVEKNANLEAQDNRLRSTALMFACELNLEKVALKLIEKEANLGAKDKNGMTALMTTCLKKREILALKLVEKNANLEARDKYGSTALMIACYAGLESVALELVKKNANLEAKDVDGGTALMLACHSGLESVALELVKKNANLEAINNKSETALMAACKNNQQAVALKLVEKNANLSAEDNDGVTALMLACGFKHEEVAHMLVEKNANLSAQDNAQGWTALMIACQYNQESLALKLVEKNANLEAQGREGMTALILAVNAHKKNVVRALLDKKISTDEVCTQADFNCTALGLARSGGNQEIIKMLEDAEALEIPAYKSDA